MIERLRNAGLGSRGWWSRGGLTGVDISVILDRSVSVSGLTQTKKYGESDG